MQGDSGETLEDLDTRAIESELFLRVGRVQTSSFKLKVHKTANYVPWGIPPPSMVAEPFAPIQRAPRYQEVSPEDSGMLLTQGFCL